VPDETKTPAADGAAVGGFPAAKLKVVSHLYLLWVPPSRRHQGRHCRSQLKDLVRFSGTQGQSSRMDFSPPLNWGSDN
jgi:hypothetical protein